MYDPETDIYEMENDKPLVLLIGGVGHEGVLSSLRAAGRQYKNKLLESKAANWESIVSYFDEFPVEGVLVKLSPSAITLACNSEYNGIRERLFEKIASVPNILFVYEDILSGNYKQDDDWEGYHRKPTHEAREQFFEFIADYEIKLMPYKRNAEVTVMAQTFLADTEHNLLFRIYTPSGRLWFNEADKLLQLFRDYLAKVSGLSVRLDQIRTDKGVIYEIHSDSADRNTDVDFEFSGFTQFMDLCVADLDAAAKVLRSKSIAEKDIIPILSRYSKEAKRLSVDLKHERESKVLSIRHRLESELVDNMPEATDWSFIGQLINITVPQLSGTQSAIAIDQNLSMVTGIGPTHNLTINLNPQIVETVNGVIAQEITGNQNTGLEAKQLLELIQSYGGKDAAELASSVHELEDTSAPKGGRLNAKQRLKRFLISVSSKGGDVATGVLQSYIETKLGL
ncbi:hypothetical protein ACUN9V_16435 [Salinicola sp. V024]|uniref:hypothetical protein n=1 Tax=Salinicola sp. V024 TaxID=3459609 RepID=UPI0040440720